MRVVSLAYHDVVSRGDCKASGRPGTSPSRYTLERNEFEKHLAAIAKLRWTKPSSALDILKGQSELLPFLLTFDDGGVSGYDCVANLLESYDWRGHFFITTNDIGAPGFVTKEQVRDLRKRGHVIGSHSCSHPERMSYCSWSELIQEWTRSVGILSDFLGEQVTVASVPGGYYSRKVAEAAGFAGIKALFTSEPVTRPCYVDGCLVLGRFLMLRGTLPTTAAALAAGNPSPRLKQFLFWNLKKLAKHLGGEAYLSLRKLILKYEWRTQRV